MAKERREHRIALEVLYAVDVGKAPLDEVLRQAREGIGVFSRGDQAAEEDAYEPAMPAMDRRADTPRATEWSLVEDLVRGTLTRKGELEMQIAPLLKRWTIERLSGVDRLVLDLAAWELRYRSDAETTDVINHAVELARRLSTERSAQFVNGVLDALAHTPPSGLSV
ncbi:MAG: transcription antitermination factor NusB [Candidatus Eremiobacteraeota bacterium]|nr:transcription antitermination factor NusB [Candidatus Eremiobacteraeota bacterium]MBV8366589.1 transcription antitermination factor NusB [Candidatus Eremiobacteraeota bacterium]